MVFPNLVKFQVKETDQSITPFAGLALIGRLAKQLRLLDRINQTLPFKERERGFHPSEVVMSIANVFLAGGTCINDVHAFDSTAPYGDRKLFWRTRLRRIRLVRKTRWYPVEES